MEPQEDDPRPRNDMLCYIIICIIIISVAGICTYVYIYIYTHILSTIYYDAFAGTTPDPTAPSFAGSRVEHISFKTGQ